MSLRATVAKLCTRPPGLILAVDQTVLLWDQGEPSMALQATVHLQRSAFPEIRIVNSGAMPFAEHERQEPVMLLARDVADSYPVAREAVQVRETLREDVQKSVAHRFVGLQLGKLSAVGGIWTEFTDPKAELLCLLSGPLRDLWYNFMLNQISLYCVPDAVFPLANVLKSRLPRIRSRRFRALRRGHSHAVGQVVLLWGQGDQIAVPPAILMVARGAPGGSARGYPCLDDRCVRARGAGCGAGEAGGGARLRRHGGCQGPRDASRGRAEAHVACT